MWNICFFWQELAGDISWLLNLWSQVTQKHNVSHLLISWIFWYFMNFHSLCFLAECHMPLVIFKKVKKVYEVLLEGPLWRIRNAVSIMRKGWESVHCVFCLRKTTLCDNKIICWRVTSLRNIIFDQYPTVTDNRLQKNVCKRIKAPCFNLMYLECIT